MNEHELLQKYEQISGESPLKSEFLDWRGQYIEKNLKIWEEKFLFLEHWNVYLVAQYNREKGRQRLLIQEYNPEKLITRAIRRSLYHEIKGARGDTQQLETLRGIIQGGVLQPYLNALNGNYQPPKA